VKCGHEYIAQVKANQKELLKWVEFNTSIDDAKPIDTYINYDHNMMIFIKLKIIGNLLTEL